MLLAAGAAAAAAQGLPRQERASFALRATGQTAPGSTARLAGVVTIEPGWHVNSHQPTFEYLIPTTITVTAPGGWPTRIDYPAGVTKKFGFSEEPLAVYDGTLEIPIELDVPATAASATVTVAAELRYQACDDRSCLPPVTTQASVELAVGMAGAADTPAATPGAPAASGEQGAASRSLGWMLLLAFSAG